MEHFGFIAYIVSWLTVITGVFTLFEKASDSLKEESKIAISQWLMNVGMEGGQPNWPTMFVATFDSVFTKRHLSWTCFWRSSLASFFAVILISLLVNALGISTVFQEIISETWLGFFFILLVGAILNLIPDYVSLLETRVVIKLMSKKATFFRILMLLLLDLVATNVIFFVIAFIIIVNLINLFTRVAWAWETPGGALGAYIQGLTFSGKEKDLGIFIYSTFFTSIWVWLYAFSGFFVGIISKSKSVLDFFKKHLAIEDRPLRSMAFVIVLIITFGYLVGGLFLLQK